MLIKLEQIDDLIRTGEIHRAREALSQVAIPRSAPIATLAYLANLFKRTGNPIEAIRLVSPRLKDDNGKRQELGPLWMEYADSMTGLNAVSTSMRVLKRENLSIYPRTDLYLAYAKMHSWDYAAAEGLLRAFLASARSDDYYSWVAQVNHAACLVALSRLKEADLALGRLYGSLKELRYQRLLYNTLELRIQIAVAAGAGRELSDLLSTIRKLSATGIGTVDELFMRKWKAIALLGKNREKGLRELQALRKECRGNAYAELARDLDYRYALAVQDEQLLNQVWCGTPSPFFRAGMKFTLKTQAHKFTFQTTAKGSGKPQGSAQRTAKWLKSEAPSLTYRLFSAILADSYRKPSVIELFERVYPDSYFNPDTSPLRVHQLLHRLRGELEASKTGLTVECPEAVYEIKSSQTQLICLTEPFWRVIEMSPLQTELATAVRAIGPSFTAKQFGKTLGKSPRNAQILLKKLREESLLIREGSARSTTYRLS